MDLPLCRTLPIGRGTTTPDSYDNLRRGTGLTTLRASGTPTITTISRVLDRATNVLSVSARQESDNSGPTVFPVDKLYGYDRLTRMIDTVNAGAPDTDISHFGYDSAGNRIRTKKGPDGQGDPEVTYTVDKADRLVDVGGNAVRTNWRGNIFFRGAIDGDLSFEYDHLNRLIRSFNDPDGTVGTYAYNGMGVRIRKSYKDGESMVNVGYLQDQASSNAVVLTDGRSSFYWLGTQPLYSFGQDGFVVNHPDLNGNVVNQTDASATFKYAYGSGPFGERSTDALANYGVTQSDGGSKTLPFRFAGGAELDFETGQQYLRARYFLPSAGRFTSRDTYGGQASKPQSLNRYSYTGNNPLNRRDPSGHCPNCAQGAIIGAQVGGAVGGPGGAVIGAVVGGVAGAAAGAAIGIGIGQAIKENMDDEEEEWQKQVDEDIAAVTAAVAASGKPTAGHWNDRVKERIEDGSTNGPEIIRAMNGKKYEQIEDGREIRVDPRSGTAVVVDIDGTWVSVLPNDQGNNNGKINNGAWVPK